jgi:hypothetical protein
VDGLGGGSAGAGSGVSDRCSASSLCDLPALCQEQPRCAEARQGEAAEDGTDDQERDHHERHAAGHGKSNSLDKIPN